MREKNGQKIFFTGKFAFFFKKLCFQQLLRCYRIIPVTSGLIVKILCWPVERVNWGFSHSRMRQKIGQNLFFTGKDAFFFRKIVFSTTAWVLQKWSCNFHSNCEITLWTLIRCPFRSITLDKSGENTTKTFFHCKVCLFFQKFVFSTTS